VLHAVFQPYLRYSVVQAESRGGLGRWWTGAFGSPGVPVLTLLLALQGASRFLISHLGLVTLAGSQGCRDEVRWCRRKCVVRCDVPQSHFRVSLPCETTLFTNSKRPYPRPVVGFPRCKLRVWVRCLVPACLGSVWECVTQELPPWFTASSCLLFTREWCLKVSVVWVLEACSLSRRTKIISQLCFLISLWA
jgi:hypothetical protein